ncbi:MAG: NFACT RNA binding domain-containing protein, partial [Polyangiales bacterium]
MTIDSKRPIWLEGAIVQKVERLTEVAVLLTVRTVGWTVSLLALASAHPAVGEIEWPSRRTSADAQVMRLRRLFEGARVLSLRAKPDWFRLAVRRGDERRALLVVPGAMTVVEGEESSHEDVVTSDLSAASAFERHERELFAARKKALISAIDGQRKKLRRRVEAIEGDLAKIEGADTWKAQGTLIVTHLHAIPRGAKSAELDDWSTGEAVKIVIPLDPSKSAKENADALFHRAKRLEKGRAIAEGRRQEAERAIATLDRLREEALEADALEPLEARAKTLGIKPQKPGVRAREEERLPYVAYKSGERTIFVGRGAKDNDALTTKIAKPHDLWLHAKGWTGAHVIVPMQKNESPAPELLVDAAHLAAHFSDARGESSVEIQWTPRRYVRKPKG